MLRRIAAVLCAVSLLSTLPAHATAAQQSSDPLTEVIGSMTDSQHSLETGSTKAGSVEKGSADFDLFQGKQPSQVMRSIMMVLGIALAALTFFGIFGAQIANLFGIRL